ncbi:MAG TPA: bifunctional precorrin-2 dehydrogenase/sirohydrochlorin ferrochelatase, partial [Acidimicrobiales bacterium]|nr:bifunctional precorrin-2 dehydrogenase/sirohydrochlorin ferrochelatase [Acidimicrobiales bacterium]
ETGACVVVVAPELSDLVAGLVESVPSVSWRQGYFEPGDLEGVHLAVAATNDAAVDQRVFDLAEARGTFVHCPDDPARCSAYAMALVHRGHVTVAVTTAGTSPTLAVYLKDWLDARLDDGLGGVAELLADVRRELHDAGRSTEGREWHGVVDDELVATVAEGRSAQAAARVRAAVLNEGALR